jgi:RimJ/RimL family protein N-acetyltransferase
MVSKAFGKIEASAEITSLPGCSQIAVIHSAFVNPNRRGRGIGSRVHMERLDKLYGDFLYDVAIATVDTANKPQMRIMEKAGWRQAEVFKSRKTGNCVAIFIKHLED